MMKSSFVKYIIFIVITVTVVSSCVTEDNYKYWSFFFDGVPDPSRSDNLEINLSDSSALAIEDDITKNTPRIFKHAPYSENECNLCRLLAIS